MIAVTKEVEFEALTLDHLDIGDVGDDDLGKVGLVGDRAKAGKLWAIELHPVVSSRVPILEGLQNGRIVLCRVFGAATPE